MPNQLDPTLGSRLEWRSPKVPSSLNYSKILYLPAQQEITWAVACSGRAQRCLFHRNVEEFSNFSTSVCLSKLVDITDGYNKGETKSLGLVFSGNQTRSLVLTGTSCAQHWGLLRNTQLSICRGAVQQECSKLHTQYCLLNTSQLDAVWYNKSEDAVPLLCVPPVFFDTILSKLVLLHWVPKGETEDWIAGVQLHQHKCERAGVKIDTGIVHCAALRPTASGQVQRWCKKQAQTSLLSDL